MPRIVTPKRLRFAWLLDKIHLMEWPTVLAFYHKGVASAASGNPL
jgi:hypothetical protein